jgi:hypothetical protein
MRGNDFSLYSVCAKSLARLVSCPSFQYQSSASLTVLLIRSASGRLGPAPIAPIRFVCLTNVFWRAVWVGPHGLRGPAEREHHRTHGQRDDPAGCQISPGILPTILVPSLRKLKLVVLHVNDAAVKIRIVEFVSKVYSSFMYMLQNRLKRGGERGEGCQCGHPYDLLCWLTVIWSGAPTDSLGGVPQNCEYFAVFCEKMQQLG